MPEPDDSLYTPDIRTFFSRAREEHAVWLPSTPAWDGILKAEVLKPRKVNAHTYGVLVAEVRTNFDLCLTNLAIDGFLGRKREPGSTKAAVDNLAAQLEEE